MFFQVPNVVMLFQLLLRRPVILTVDFVLLDHWGSNMATPAWLLGYPFLTTDGWTSSRDVALLGIRTDGF